MRAVHLTLALVVLAAPARALAYDDDDRPFGRGTILPSVALGGSFSGRYGGSLLVGAGASYFVAKGFAVGLHLRNVSTFYSSTFKAELGRAFEQVPTNELSLMPSAMWVLWRSRTFSPYLTAGVGPVFLNKHRGALGQWSAGPGFLIGFGGAMFIDLGLSFGMRFTGDRCEAAYTFKDPDTGGTFTNGAACSFTWGFRGGIVFGFGGRRGPRSSSSSSPSPSYQGPPPSSYPAPTYTPPPSGPPVSNDSPTPSAAQPVDAAPTEPALAPAPTDPSAPAGESLPVPPPA